MLIFIIWELKIKTKCFLKIGQIDKDWYYSLLGFLHHRKYILIANQYGHTQRTETEVSQTVLIFTISQPVLYFLVHPTLSFV